MRVVATAVNVGSSLANLMGAPRKKTGKKSNVNGRSALKFPHNPLLLLHYSIRGDTLGDEELSCAIDLTFRNAVPPMRYIRKICDLAFHR